MSGVLYHTPAEIIAQLMDDLGLANLETTGTADPDTDWTVFPIHLPESPEQAILVKDSMGRLHRRSHPTGVAGEHYGIQILARSSQDPATPYRKVKDVLQCFDTEVNRDEVTLSDEDDVDRVYRVNAITRVSTVAPAGNDGRRFLYSGNLIASIELVEETGTGT